MIKVDELIQKFHELKEELNKAVCPYTHKDAKLCPADCPCKKDMNKNVNMSYSGAPNMPSSMGTSGGQGGMYRSEDMEKQTMNPSAGGAQDMSMIKARANGQWHMEKAEPQKGHSAFTMDHVRQVAGMTDHGAAKKMAHSVVDGSGATSQNKAKMKMMIDKSRTPAHLAQGMSNHILAHPSEGLKVVSPTAKGEGKETKHDRCAREVGAKGGIDNPHAVCVAAGVEPEKWKKSADDIIEKLEKVAHYTSKDGTNREANPKLKAHDLGPGGKVHLVKQEGTNEKANPTQPHNKDKFKVMPMTSEKDEKHAGASGKPYDGKEKDVKKGEECPKCHRDPCECKMEKGNVQGNEAKGFDENKAPGRGALAV